MPSYNKATIIGHLGRDPEIRMTQGGTKVANFSVAVSEKWKDKTTDQWQEKTLWMSVTAWRYLADKAEERLHKGALVLVSGKLNEKKWTGRDGVDKSRIELEASDIVPLEKTEKKQPVAFTAPPLPAEAQDGSTEIPEDDLPF